MRLACGFWLAGLPLALSTLYPKKNKFFRGAGPGEEGLDTRLASGDFFLSFLVGLLKICESHYISQQ